MQGRGLSSRSEAARTTTRTTVADEPSGGAPWRGADGFAALPRGVDEAARLGDLWEPGGANRRRSPWQSCPEHDQKALLKMDLYRNCGQNGFVS